MLALEQGLRKRRMGGEVVRLEVANEMPDDVIDMLMTGLNVEEADLYKVDGPLGLDDLFGLTGLPVSKLKSKSHTGQTPSTLARTQQNLIDEGTIKPEEFKTIFSVMRQQDILLHHPYDLFSTTDDEFINQAADEPKGDGNQNDPLPNFDRLTNHRGPDSRRRKWKTSHGTGGAQSQIR